MRYIFKIGAEKGHLFSFVSSRSNKKVFTDKKQKYHRYFIFNRSFGAPNSKKNITYFNSG